MKKDCKHKNTRQESRETYPDGDPNSVHYYDVSVCEDCGEESPN